MTKNVYRDDEIAGQFQYPEWAREAVDALNRDQGDLSWQVEQWREQNLAILGQWEAEKARADEVEHKLAEAREEIHRLRTKIGRARSALKDRNA